MSRATPIPVVMPAKPAPISVDIGRNQSMLSSAGNPGRFAIPANPPANTIVKNTGITSDGMKVERSRGMSTRLRLAIPHVIAVVDIVRPSSAQGQPALERQSGQKIAHNEDPRRDPEGDKKIPHVEPLDHKRSRRLAEPG